MMQFTNGFSGFSVDNLEEAKAFYKDILGLTVVEEEGVTLHLPGGNTVFMYDKDEHEPASFTILNFVVADIDKAVAQLSEQGVQFEHYDNMEQDEKEIMRGLSHNQGPDIAWFKDPAGNIIALLQTER